MEKIQVTWTQVTWTPGKCLEQVHEPNLGGTMVPHIPALESQIYINGNNTAIVKRKKQNWSCFNSIILQDGLEFLFVVKISKSETECELQVVIVFFFLTTNF